MQFPFSLKYGRNQWKTAQFFYRHWPFRSWSNRQQKKKLKKTRKLHVSQIFRKREHHFEYSKPLITSGLWLLKHFLVTRVHLALIFSIFPINFELFIHSYRSTGSHVLAETKVINVDQPIGTFVYFFWGVVRILNKRLLRADSCCRSVINEFAHAFSCAYIEYNGCTWEAWRALRKL